MKRTLDAINEKILAAYGKRQLNPLYCSQFPPRLVAVSKYKPVSAIVEAYECGHRHFGENYIQELVEKSNSPEIITKCPDIKFHFIGHLQSNKVNKLMKVRNLEFVETVDSIKLANLINKAIDRLQTEQLSSGEEQQNSTLETNQFSKERRLNVMIQVNTSGEEQKNGIQPEEAGTLAQHIVEKCNWLNFAGIMTIGKLDSWPEGGPNKDFQRMLELREQLSSKLSLDPKLLELSMGMSSDFEEAIELGSTSVRIGTSIFGSRQAN